MGWFVQIQTKWVLGRQMWQSVNCAPARRLKLCRMALLSLANRWATWSIKRNKIFSDIFKLKNVCACVCVKQVNWLRVCSNWNKTAGARQVMWSANCAPARRLKKVRWIALLSLWEHTGVKKWHINEMWKRNTLEHLQTKKIQNWTRKMQFCSNRDEIVDREAGVTT